MLARGAAALAHDLGRRFPRNRTVGASPRLHRGEGGLARAGRAADQDVLAKTDGEVEKRRPACGGVLAYNLPQSPEAKAQVKRIDVKKG